MTRHERTAERIKRLIESNDVAGLSAIDQLRPCACRGCVDDEPLCVCYMDRRQLRQTVSVPALRRGEIKLLRRTA